MTGVYGIDYLSENEELDFLIVDADSEEDAKKKAGKLLNTLGLPKRNILSVERYEWLDK